MAKQTLKKLRQDLNTVGQVAVWMGVVTPGGQLVGGYVPAYKSHIVDVTRMYDPHFWVEYEIAEGVLYVKFP